MASWKLLVIWMEVAGPRSIGHDGKLWVEPSYEVQEGEITPGRISRWFPFLCRRNVGKVIEVEEVCAWEEDREGGWEACSGEPVKEWMGCG